MSNTAFGFITAQALTLLQRCFPLREGGYAALCGSLIVADGFFCLSGYHCKCFGLFNRKIGK